MTRHPAAVALLCSVCLLGHPRSGTTVYGFDRGGQQDLVVDTRPSADDPDLLIFDILGGTAHNPPPGADDPTCSSWTSSEIPCTLSGAPATT